MDEQTQPTPALDKLTEEQKAAIQEVSNRKKGRPKKSLNIAIATACVALKESGMTVEQIGEMVGLGKDVVRRHLLGAKSVSAVDVEKVRNGVTTELASIIQNLLSKASSEETTERLNGAQLITAAAIMIDKFNVMTGNPSKIVETRSVVEDAKRQLEEIKKEKAELMKFITPAETPKVN